MKNFKEQTSLSRWISGHLPLKKGEVFKGGFTLIELLVVITIIGILTIITVTSFVTAQQRARDASRKSELKSLADALNAYYADYGWFPDSSAINSLISGSSEFSDGTGDDKIIYMKKMPNDSSAGVGGHLQFKYVSTLKSFRLYTNLENDKDGDCRFDCLASEYNVTSGCCYAITSSNIGLTDSLE